MEKQEFIEVAAKHFIIAAQWIETPDSWMREAKPTKAAKRVALRYVADFIDAAGPLIAQLDDCAGYGSHPDAGSPAAAFGHDLYLTSQGHGVGFWDRKELEIETPTGETLGDALTALAEKPNFASFYPEFYRGWLYLHWAAACDGGTK